jgi:hypothetical protein
MIHTLSLQTQEEIRLLLLMKFSDDDVLPTPTERKDRLKMLLEAIRKAEKQEVVLHVRTNGLVHRIQSRIFDTWSGLVLINKGLTIPLACIAQVEHIA